MSRFCPFLPDGNPRAFNQPVVTDRCDRVMFPAGGKWQSVTKATCPSDIGYLIIRNALPGAHPSLQTSDNSSPLRLTSLGRA